MNVKAEVYRRVINLLEDEADRQRRKLWENRRTMKALAEEQTIIKRECSALYALLRDFRGKPSPPAKCECPNPMDPERSMTDA